MNIFFLAGDPRSAARFHCDKHVITMIKESAQLLSTAIHVASAGSIPTYYKPTHANHPCGIWARESLANWNWLHSLMIALDDEYRFRFDKPESHLSVRLMEANEIVEKAARCLPGLQSDDITEPALAIPPQYQIPGNAIASYRAYYIGDKAHMLNYTKRERPEWIPT